MYKFLPEIRELDYRVNQLNSCLIPSPQRAEARKNHAVVKDATDLERLQRHEERFHCVKQDFEQKMAKFQSLDQ